MSLCAHKQSQQRCVSFLPQASLRGERVMSLEARGAEALAAMAQLRSELNVAASERSRAQADAEVAKIMLASA